MKKKNGILFAVLILLIMSVLTACTAQNTTVTPAPEPSSKVKVHFIDVGQADCIFIQLADGRNVLIDGGNRGDAEVILNYLQGQNVKKLDYLIATHPHEDHIGALPDVVRSFEIGSIYMPKTTANTKIFESLLEEIQSKGYKINSAKAGVSIIGNKDTKLDIVAPNASEYDETNNYSAVLKLTYLNTSFLFTGDAEDVSEEEILNGNFDIKADLLKVGHHGGRTSTTMEFLEQVNPKFAVISVGKGNDYGHPHKETLERLKSMNLQIYRTDEQGTIVAVSDGKSITIDKTPMVYSPSNDVSADFYIANKNSKIYHLPNCSGLPKIENQLKLSSKSEAQKKGYEPCKICKP